MTRRLTRILMLALAGFACILIVAVPIQPGATQWPMPDLLLMLCCYWVLRRPDSAPILVLFALGLIADLILMRPIGIGALALVLITELLRAQIRTLRDTAFPLEWLTVAILVGIGMLLQMALLWISLGTLPMPIEVAQYAGITILSYPAVALFCGGILGLRHRTSGKISYSNYLGEG